MNNPDRANESAAPDRGSINAKIAQIIDDAEKPKEHFPYAAFFKAMHDVEEHFKTDRESVIKAEQEEGKEDESKL